MLRLTLTERECLPDVSYDGVPARPIPSSFKALCTFRTAFNNLKRSFLVHNSVISVVYAAWQIMSSDVKQAEWQSRDGLARVVYAHDTKVYTLKAIKWRKNKVHWDLSWCKKAEENYETHFMISICDKTCVSWENRETGDTQQTVHATVVWHK